jgi:hypothetical protein
MKTVARGRGPGQADLLAARLRLGELNMSKRLRRVLAMAAATAAMGAAAQASAAELITNGGFEAGGGSLAGWTVTLTGAGNADVLTAADYHPCCGTVGSEPAYSGNHFVEFGDGNVTGTQTVSQTFNTLAGHTYVISFDLGAFGAGTEPVAFQVGLFSDGLNAVANNNNDTTFLHQSYTLVSTGGLKTISFSVTSFPDNIDPILDNVSVVGDAVRGGVPEPGVWALMLTGFAGAGAALRRRAKTAVA